MNTREYVPPTLQELLDRAFQIRDTYSRDNPERLRLISILENTSLYINKILYEQKKIQMELKANPNLDPNNYPILNITEEELHNSFLGTWFFVAEHIAKDYKWFDPVYTPGFFMDTGSTTLRSILQALNILDKDYKKTDNVPSEVYKYKRVINFHNFSFTEKYAAVHQNIQHDFSNNENIDPAEVREQEIVVIKRLFIKVATEFKKIWKGIPLPEDDKEDLKNLPDNYLNAKQKEREEAWFKWLHRDNPARLYLAQLASTAAGMSDNQDVYRGMRLLLAYVVSQDYSCFSPTGSQLYTLVVELLNIIELTDISNEKQREHLIAARKFLEQNDIAEKIKKYADEKFKDKNLLHENINSKLDDAIEKIKSICESLSGNNHQNNWYFAKLFIGVGSSILGALGFALGSMFGYTMSETKQASTGKGFVGNLVTKASELTGNQSGGLFSYLFGDIFIRTFLMRWCGKTFEYLFVLAGLGGLGLAGGSLDLAYQEFRKHCERSRDEAAKLNDPKPLKDCDAELFQSFLDTPREVMGLKENQHLQKIGKSLIEKMAQKINPIAVPVAN